MNIAIKSVTAAILVGGLGTRLRPAIGDTAKPMANTLNNKPFLSILISELANAGINNILLLTGYQSHQISDYFGDGSNFGVKICYSHETTPLGTAGAVLNAKSHLCENPFFLLNGDSYIEGGFKHFLKFINLNNESHYILTTNSLITKQFGKIKVDNQSRVISFNEKCESTHSSTVNAGIYLLKPKIFDYIEENKKCSLEKEVIPNLIKSEELIAVNHNGQLYDIGTPPSYEKFNNDVHKIVHVLENSE